MSSRGLKRICAECGTRFYDLNKNPIICPSCGAEYTGMVKIKTRKGKGANDDKPAKPDRSEEVETLEENHDEVSLTDLEDQEDTDGDDEENSLDDADLDLDDLDNVDDNDDDMDDLDGDLNVELDEDDR